MDDVFNKSKRSAVMAAIRSTGNKDTELRLVRILRKYGITGWRRRLPLPGNEGFCVDLAMADQRQPGSIGVGVICDLTRFDRADDPAEWDIFRTNILESQGWKFYRLWSPRFFLDSDRHCREIVKSAGNSSQDYEDRFE